MLDTNSALSGLLWRGTPGRLIDAADTGLIELVSSMPLLTELQEVLFRSKFAAQLKQRGLRPTDVFDGYAAMVIVVAPAVIAPTIARDPSDDHVLACALAAQADLIVSGDKHLHGLGGQFRGIRIVTPAEAVRLINEP